MKPKTTITVELTEDEAMAMAQFLKRYIWTDVRKSAVDDAEAYLMRDAFTSIQHSLEDVGYSPR